MIVARLHLPWPDRALSPNGRPSHWAVKARAAKAQRNTAAVLARNAQLHMVTVPPGAHVNIRLVACPKSRGPYPDDDNLVASMKHALDGIAAVLRVDDSRFRVQGVQRGERCRDGAVIVVAEVVE